jgi:hypothetical protein
VIAGVNWTAVAAIMGVVVTLAGFCVWLLRARFQGDFASRGDVADLGERMGKIETRLRDTPTHADVSALSTRLAAVETGVAVVSAELRGIRDGVTRIEHAVRVLHEHELAKAREGKGT